MNICHVYCKAKQITHLRNLESTKLLPPHPVLYHIEPIDACYHLNMLEECSSHCTIALISRASKVMLKILLARLQQYVDHKLPNVQAGFRKGRGTSDQIANICRIIKKARVAEKNIYFCFINHVKAVDYVDHNKLCKILQDIGISDHVTCLLRNLYAGQEVTELNMEQQTGSK